MRSARSAAPACVFGWGMSHSHVRLAHGSTFCAPYPLHTPESSPDPSFRCASVPLRTSLARQWCGRDAVTFVSFHFLRVSGFALFRVVVRRAFSLAVFSLGFKLYLYLPLVTLFRRGLRPQTSSHRTASESVLTLYPTSASANINAGCFGLRPSPCLFLSTARAALAHR